MYFEIKDYNPVTNEFALLLLIFKTKISARVGVAQKLTRTRTFLT